MDNEIYLNKIFKYEFEFTQMDVENFAKASGDYNPIHLDSNYAQNTIFGRTIIHGFLSGSVFSKVFGTIFPGNGTIYLKQDMKFLKPMFTKEAYQAVFTITEVINEKNRARVSTEIFDSQGKPTISGEALIQHVDIR